MPIDKFRAVSGTVRATRAQRWASDRVFRKVDDGRHLLRIIVGGADRSKEGPRSFKFRVGKAYASRATELGALGPLLSGDRVVPGFCFVDAEHCDDPLLGQCSC